MRKVVILVSGKQGSGKDTLVDGLAASGLNGPVYFNRIKFAKTIYEMHDNIRNILRHKGINVGKKKDGDLLQYLGTDYGRVTYGRNVWVDCFLADCNLAFRSYERMRGNPIVGVLCSDLRFKNEFHAFDEHPDKLVIKIRLRCDRLDRMKRAQGWRDNENHVSETDLDCYDADGLFDLTLNTSELTAKQTLAKAVEHIGARLSLTTQLSNGPAH